MRSKRCVCAAFCSLQPAEPDLASTRISKRFARVRSTPDRGCRTRPRGRLERALTGRQLAVLDDLDVVGIGAGQAHSPTINCRNRRAQGRARPSTMFVKRLSRRGDAPIRVRESR